VNTLELIGIDIRDQSSNVLVPNAIVSSASETVYEVVETPEPGGLAILAGLTVAGMLRRRRR
jgi:hypothetical protein